MRPFFLQLHLVLISCLFLREYFGNQASLTNCSGTLIRLADSTASAPPVRRNKGSFQQVSFFIIHMSWVESFYHLIFRDISLNSQESFVLVFRHISFYIQWNFVYSLFSFELSFKLSNLYSFIYSNLYIRLFIRI